MEWIWIDIEDCMYQKKVCKGDGGQMVTMHSFNDETFPVFDKKEDSKAYTRRIGVYGLLIHEDKIGIIEMMDDHEFFLPGGGLENGESMNECLEREFFEEIGSDCILLEYIGLSGRYFHSERRHEYFYGLGYFYVVKLDGERRKPIEKNHRLVWLTLAEAKQKLHHNYQTWAIEAYQRKMKNRALRKLEVVDHANEWHEYFRSECNVLEDILGEDCLRIEHIGSTAVKDLPAKPIIDILVEIDHYDTLETYNGVLCKNGYVYVGEVEVPDRKFYYKEIDGVRTHHLHVYRENNPIISEQLGFRDYLRAHDEVRIEYGNAKKNALVKSGNDIEKYMLYKSGFIENILKTL